MSDSLSSIDIPVDAEVHCKDGRSGTTRTLILNPATKKITNIVVEYHNTKHLVPRNLVAATTPDLLVLDCTREELKKMESFMKIQFLNVRIPEHSFPMTADYLLEPYVFIDEAVLYQEEELIPPGELAIRRSNVVYARDGHIGTVDEFVGNRETGGRYE